MYKTNDSFDNRKALSQSPGPFLPLDWWVQTPVGRTESFKTVYYSIRVGIRCYFIIVTGDVWTTVLKNWDVPTLKMKAKKKKKGHAYYSFSSLFLAEYSVCKSYFPLHIYMLNYFQEPTLCVFSALGTLCCLFALNTWVFLHLSVFCDSFISLEYLPLTFFPGKYSFMQSCFFPPE